MGVLISLTSTLPALLSAQGGAGVHAWVEAASTRRALAAARALAPGAGVAVLSDSVVTDDAFLPAPVPTAEFGPDTATSAVPMSGGYEQGAELQEYGAAAAPPAAAAQALALLSDRSAHFFFAELPAALHASSAAAPAVAAARRAGEDVLRLLVLADDGGNAGPTEEGRRQEISMFSPTGDTVVSADMDQPDGVSAALRAVYPRAEESGKEDTAVVVVVRVAAEA